MDPLLHIPDIEIQQETQPPFCESKIRQNLRSMNGQHRFDRFYFDDHLIIHKQINAISDIEMYAFIYQWKRQLPLHTTTGSLKLMGKTMLVGGFKQSRTKAGMHGIRTANNCIRYSVELFNGHQISLI